jgi:hypothetical protein
MPHEWKLKKNRIKMAIKGDHLKALKLELKGDKLKDMANSDVSSRREYTSWNVEECRMAFRLETKMFVCRANMPTLYKRDLTCRSCMTETSQESAGQMEDQDHLECCPGYSSLWAGLGPLTARVRVQYFLRVDNRRRGAVGSI